VSLQVVGPDECLIASRVGANVRSLSGVGRALMLLKTPELVKGSATAGKITNVHHESWVDACALEHPSRAHARSKNWNINAIILMSLQVFVV
jgi:hypothetical protein